VSAVIGLSLSGAKDAAIIVVIVLVLASIISARVVSSVTQKVLTIAVLLLLAFGVWSQRQSLQSCADTVEASASAVDKQLNVPAGDVSIPKTTCKFFGKSITVGAGS
jgi:hypothetical protein